MNAITYLNTKTTIPNWAEALHEKFPRGFAYESKNHFIHIYAAENHTWPLHLGLTATEEKKSETLNEWVVRVFGARDIKSVSHEVGSLTTGVWRPGTSMDNQVYQVLSLSQHEKMTACQALRVLIEKLDEIQIYIEPSLTGLKSYGHKTRELLILACMEVENYWAQYMRTSNLRPKNKSFTTNDYVKLAAPLHLGEYEISFNHFKDIQPIRPFYAWTANNPTQSLSWYDAYNKTKHDRETYFPEATLENCLWALSAAMCMFCVRHSPFPLINENTSLSVLFNQHFSINLKAPDPTSFYIPKIELQSNRRSDLICADARSLFTAWTAKPFSL